MNQISLSNPFLLIFFSWNKNYQDYDIINFFNVNTESLSVGIVFASLDFLFYAFLISLLGIFARCYATLSAFNLLSKFSESSRYFVEFIFVMLCFQLYYWSLNPEVLSISGVSLFNETYRISFFTQSMKLIATALWLALFRYTYSLGFSLSIFKHQGIAEFPILSLLVLNFSFTLISSDNLGLLLISLEGLSLILYVLATIGRLNGGITAAVKYFAFGTAGSILIFWGLAHVYGLLGTLSLTTLFFVSEASEEFFVTHVGWVGNFEWIATLLVLGFLVKLGAAPTHQWISDVYAGVPLLITAIYAILIKFVLYVIFIRFSYFLLNGQELEYVAVLSLIVGVWGTLKQTEIKRFLAYGSIVHVGFLLSGDLISSFVYLTSYLISSLLFFSVLLQARFFNKELVYLSDLRFLSQSSLSFKFFVVVALASMAGLPPFAGFYGKMMIWSSLVEDIYLFNDFASFAILLINIILSLIIIFYYMKLIILIFLGSESNVYQNAHSSIYNFLILNSFTDVTKFFRSDLIYPFGATNPKLPVFETLIYIKVRNTDFYVISMLLSIMLAFWTLGMPYIVTSVNFVLSSI